MSKFWFEQTRHIVPNHFIALAEDTEELGDLAEHPLLKDLDPQIAQQAMVVKRAERIDAECVVRAYLTGSALVDYNATGTMFGVPMAPGLVDGSRLPELMFTPTTKAEVGHDEPLNAEEMAALVGAEMATTLRDLSFAVFQHAHDVAADRGIIIADTKFEFGVRDGEVILIDEVLTPDSSRFWDASGWNPGKSQPNYDKQFVRDWLLTQKDWDRTPPAPPLPDDVVQKTTERYWEAYRKLTGRAA